MKRSYNAFAVRVQGKKGGKRRVVPARETDEGELCIEMWIRLYPDGMMSGLLLQLIKVRRRDTPLRTMATAGGGHGFGPLLLQPFRAARPSDYTTVFLCSLKICLGVWYLDMHNQRMACCATQQMFYQVQF